MVVVVGLRTVGPPLAVNLLRTTRSRLGAMIGRRGLAVVAGCTVGRGPVARRFGVAWEVVARTMGRLVRPLWATRSLLDAMIGRRVLVVAAGSTLGREPVTRRFAVARAVGAQSSLTWRLLVMSGRRSLMPVVVR